jgi:hypothetical protein
MRTPARDPARDAMNVMLLPWPLHVSPADFQALPQSIHERDTEPFGLFRYRPSEPFDAALVDRLLTSAAEHVDRVDVVVAPESSVPYRSLGVLEGVLSRHGVTTLVAGMRNGSSDANGLTSNWVHLGASLGGRWWHYRQDKHHRWSLDRSQIEQYHLVSVLDPRVRWWEGIEIERRSLQILERDDGHTIASLVCEDLAQIDEVVQLLRAVGPTLVVALLLDGPQLASRWTARYASVLADDPGSAVLTLTSYGMVASSRRGDRAPSTAVALWKDGARRGIQEIDLAPGAEGILLRLDGERAIRRAADGRPPEHNAADLRLGEVVQLHAQPAAETRPGARPARTPPLSGADLTVLLTWSEALARTAATQPTNLDAVAANARAGARWRTDLNLPQPTGALSRALNSIASARGDDHLTIDGSAGPQTPRSPRAQGALWRRR